MVFVEVRRQKCSTMGPSPATRAGQSLIAKVMMKVVAVVVVVAMKMIMFNLLLFLWVSAPCWSDQGSFPLKCWDCFYKSRQHSCCCLWTNVLKCLHPLSWSHIILSIQGILQTKRWKRKRVQVFQSHALANLKKQIFVTSGLKPKGWSPSLEGGEIGFLFLK